LLLTSDLTAGGSIGTTGFDFLRTPVGARPAAMAGVFIAVPGDVYAVCYNPAGLAVLSSRHWSFSYLNHILDLQSGFAGYASPVGPVVVGSSLFYMDYGTFTRTDEQDNEMGHFSAGAAVITVAASTQLNKQWLIGGSLKYLYSKIDRYHSDAVVFDAGVMYYIPVHQLYVGAGIFNYGMVRSPFIETKDELPLNYRLGFSKRLAHLPLLLTGEIYKFVREDYEFAIGGEFTVTPHFFLRFGYNSIGRNQRLRTGSAGLAGVSLGTGFRWRQYRLDYSFTSYGEMGTLNRFSISGSF